MAKLIGNSPNQVPSNADLGDLAYQNKESVTIEKATLSSNGDNPLTLNRDTSDGTIVDLQKDGTTIGSIGVQSDDRLTIGCNDIGIGFVQDADAIVPWNQSTQSYVDNKIDLGTSSQGFKDLYLSGGVYVGGTGSANYLDDYEEGTWTPTNDGDSTGTLQNAFGDYVKIGNQVTVQGNFLIGTNFTGATIGGLPFAPTNHPSSPTGVHGNIQPRSDGSIRYFQLNNDSTSIGVKSNHNNVLVSPSTSDGTYRFFATYLTGF